MAPQWDNHTAQNIIRTRRHQVLVGILPRAHSSLIQVWCRHRKNKSIHVANSYVLRRRCAPTGSKLLGVPDMYSIIVRGIYMLSPTLTGSAVVKSPNWLTAYFWCLRTCLRKICLERGPCGRVVGCRGKLSYRQTATSRPACSDLFALSW